MPRLNKVILLRPSLVVFPLCVGPCLSPSIAALSEYRHILPEEVQKLSFDGDSAYAERCDASAPTNPFLPLAWF